MSYNINELIQELSKEHFDIETGLEKIAIYSNDKDDELRLIEVNNVAFPTGQVEPFVFASTKSYPIQIVIADVTPAEWEKICQGMISLPDNWPQKPSKVILRNQV